MSNLTDLLPSGAGGKQVSFTASGTISTGATVILNSDGTVTAAGNDTGTQGKGSASVFETGVTRLDAIDAVYDTYNNKVVVVYCDESDSDKAKAVVGTVSGTSISFGTPGNVSSTTTTYVAACFDSSVNKVIVVYADTSNTAGKAAAGTVSGTDITFGSEYQFTSDTANFVDIVYMTDESKFVAVYRDGSNNNYGTATTGTCDSSSVITWGSNTVFRSSAINWAAVCEQTAANDTSGQSRARAVVVYNRSNGSVLAPQCVAMTFISGSLGTGPENELSSSQQAEKLRIATDPVTNRFLVIFRDITASRLGAMSFALNEDSVTDKSSLVYPTGANANNPCVVYDATAAKMTVFFEDVSQSNEVSAIVCSDLTSSGLAFGSQFDITSTYASPGRNGAVYDPNTKQIFIGYRDESNSDQGTGNMYTNDYSSSNLTSTNFLGIAKSAISNGAAGDINVFGGIATSSSLLPAAVSASVGSAVTYESGAPAAGTNRVAYDTTNNKVVIAYKDGDDSKGKAVVGTVSGSSITFGSPVEFTSETGSCDVVFDPDQEKIVIAYQGPSNAGRAIVGTVSGTSISFGSEQEFASSGTSRVRCVYDTSQDKVLIIFRDDANSDYPSAIAGTISGSSITYGTEVIIQSGTLSSYPGIAFDSTNNKTLVAFGVSSDGNRTYLITLSGTTVSTSGGDYLDGSAQSTLYTDLNIAFDSTAGKHVIAYEKKTNSNYGTARVATISGSSVTFGSEVVFNAGSTDTVFPVYDPVTDRTVIGYRDGGDSNYGKFIVGTLSGTTMSFNTEANLNGTSHTAVHGGAKDPDSGNIIFATLDVGGGSTGDAVPITMTSGSPSLTIGSDYYAQSDGTISTTSTSPAVLLGQAISATTINMRNLT